VRRYLRLINREIHHLSQLIDDLFEMSQIESGTVELNLEPVDLGAVVSETIAAYEAQSRQRNVRMTCDVGANLPQVDADPTRLQRVLRNLVDNALRHTPSDGQIQLSALARDGTLEVCVNDSGPGIAEVERALVFDRFYRGERSRSRTEQPGIPGSGLGLAIARGLVEAHHGQIWVDTSPLGGAAFHIRFLA
jgi:signal transduction histidine kinase